MIATTAEVAPLPATHPYVAEASAARAAARASSVDRLRTRRFSPPSSSLPRLASSASLAAAAPAAAAFAAAGARARARSLIARARPTTATGLTRCGRIRPTSSAK